MWIKLVFSLVNLSLVSLICRLQITEVEDGGIKERNFFPNSFSAMMITEDGFVGLEVFMRKGDKCLQEPIVLSLLHVENLVGKLKSAVMVHLYYKIDKHCKLGFCKKLLIFALESLF